MMWVIRHEHGWDVEKERSLPLVPIILPGSSR